jgi:hypothetical protein
MRTDPVGLRPATPDDAPTVAAIWHVGWLDGHVGSVPERSEESFRTRAAARVADTTIAEVRGRIAPST